MMTKRWMTILLTVLLLMAGSYVIQEEEDMLVAGSKSAAQDMIPPMDQKVPPKTETATFALGWFWGPDSRFGSIAGVVRTRVGYAGGEKPNPTYHDLGDHTETLQIDYDPEVVSYSELLQIFWDSHSPGHSAWSRQYMAAVFYHNQEQKDAIEESLVRIASEIKTKIKTQVLPYTGFTRAEDYHQKYTLRKSQILMKEFQRMYQNSERFVDSMAAARINGYLAGHGGCDQLKTEIDDMGLSSEGTQRLLKVVCGRR